MSKISKVKESLRPLTRSKVIKKATSLPTIVEQLNFEPLTSRTVQNREVNTMTHQEYLGMQQSTFEMLGTVKISDVIRSMHVIWGKIKVKRVNVKRRRDPFND